MKEDDATPTPYSVVAQAAIEKPDEYKPPPTPLHQMPVKFAMFWLYKKFRVHRLVGLAYLVQYFWALGLYMLDYPAFLASPLIWSMPCTGVLQAVTAIYTFTFLPRKKEPGYTALGDVGALSYNYVVENSFFAGLLAFQV